METAQSSAHFIDAAGLIGAGRASGLFHPFGADAESFLQQIALDADPADLEGLEPDDLISLASSIWTWAAHKHPDKREIRLIEGRDHKGRPLRRDILEIVGPDVPFLVDSVIAELGAQGAHLLALFHPIVEVRRDADGTRCDQGVPRRESLIQVHLQTVPASKRDAVLMGVRETLNDVAMSVSDFAAMKARMLASAGALALAPSHIDPEEVSEAIAFLRWLANDHFTFLGARSYDFPMLVDPDEAPPEPIIRDELNLGILRDPLRLILRRTNETLVLTPEFLAYLEEPTPLIVAKSNSQSRVHRRVVMDYIGVKRYGEDGFVVGEDRFLGLFTSDSYDSMARDVPLLRRKVSRVMGRAGMVPGSHNDKKLRNIVETFPRDELFQIAEDDLLRIAQGVLHLSDRPRTKLFVRRDRFERFVSILVFIPRDRYNSSVRSQVGEVLAEAFEGRISAYYPQFGDTPLARVHFIIGIDPSAPVHPDLGALERRIVGLTATWVDALEQVNDSRGESSVPLDSWLGGFPAGYREASDAEEAIKDILELSALGGDADVRVRAYRLPEDGPDKLRAKVYRRGVAVPLSAALPILENMGLWVESETPFKLIRRMGDDNKVHWIQALNMRTANGAPLAFDSVESAFEQAFAAIWAGNTDNDGFNRLILKLGISWREAALIRALAGWRQQSGLDPSRDVQIQALSDYPAIAKGILDYFNIRFDPSLTLSLSDRTAKAETLKASIESALQDVPSLDADRVLRRMAGLVGAIQRTNFWQTALDGGPKAWISFKISPREIADLPNPKPYREIFVSSALVEGLHLRFGPVARGGLRWSDRRDDYRTEVLGLVKAQQVKNAVIVPVGSKGGFYPKRLPKNGTRDEVQAAGIEAYKTFLRGLLDITDNIDGGGKIVPAANVVRWDGDDPYLVVAADKGTATFSDIANGISAEYGHWLGDAFASGGSVGYDHKKMGITARGAWEAVKRHFREMGRDIQTEAFRVIGVGDMSGDVFGNGMLLSPEIRLVAAFDHRDIFIDPDPDPVSSFAERQRMFALPRSSWQDYAPSLISDGGGIFSRSAKAIAMSAQMKALTGLDVDEVTPNELMNALLKAKCDLLWFGGIGTYVKAKTETHADAGDKANDAIRVDADEVGALVIGEGANLGLTQRGRIAFARIGGKINTDAIDNSAGVDSSDHEVNIKILLNALVAAGTMTLPQRDDLLASMTDDVAGHVLAHNYSQTRALTLQQATAAADLDAHERFMERLETAGLLNRRVEYLPSAEELRALRMAGQGMTRPELAVIMAYSKIVLFDEIVASDAPDDAWLATTLTAYFPDGCAPYTDAMARHRLKREIIATVIANRMIDLGGATFIDRVRESAVAGTGAIVRAFSAATAIYDLDALIEAIDNLDGRVHADVQTSLLQDVVAVLRRQTFWLARKVTRSEGRGGSVGSLVAAYSAPTAQLRTVQTAILAPKERARITAHAEGLVTKGAPRALAETIAALRPMISATDIVDLAQSQAWPVEATARLYHAVGEAIGFDDLRAASGQAASPDHWDRVATRRMIEDFMDEQASVTRAVMAFAQSADGRIASGMEAPDAEWTAMTIDAWLTLNAAEVDRTRTAIAELAASGPWSFAKLSIANTQLREFAATARSV